jgi:hypothetical protein
VAELRFTNAFLDGLHVCELVSGDEPLVGHVGPERFLEPPRGTSPWSRIFSWPADRVVYLAFVGALVGKRCCLGLATDARRVAPALGRPGEPAGWRYWVDETERPGDRDMAFLPADHAALFDVNGFRDLVTLLAYEGKMTLFATAPERRVAIARALRGEEKPEVAVLLGPGDLFVDVVFGDDLNDYDSILVKSPEPIAETVDAVAEELSRRIAGYRAEVIQASSRREYLAALGRLAGLPPRGQGR